MYARVNGWEGSLFWCGQNRDRNGGMGKTCIFEDGSWVLEVSGDWFSEGGISLFCAIRVSVALFISSHNFSHTVACLLELILYMPQVQVQYILYTRIYSYVCGVC